MALVELMDDRLELTVSRLVVSPEVSFDFIAVNFSAASDSGAINTLHRVGLALTSVMAWRISCSSNRAVAPPLTSPEIRPEAPLWNVPALNGLYR